MALRRPIFGLGGAQVLVTGLVLSGAALVAFELSMAAALVVGFALSLSSTALALQILAERKQLTSQHGRASFAILLFQDLAAIPLLALIPLLQAPAASGLALVRRGQGDRHRGRRHSGRTLVAASVSAPGSFGR